jgi:hypothetical protein
MRKELIYLMSLFIFGSLQNEIFCFFRLLFYHFTLDSLYIFNLSTHVCVFGCLAACSYITLSDEVIHEMHNHLNRLLSFCALLGLRDEQLTTCSILYEKITAIISYILEVWYNHIHYSAS